MKGKCKLGFHPKLGIEKSFYNELIEVVADHSLGISKIYFETSNCRSTVQKILRLHVHLLDTFSNVRTPPKASAAMEMRPSLQW